MGCAHSNSNRKGTAHLGMDAIPTDSHLDTRIEITMRILVNVIVLRLEYAGEAWERNTKFVKPLEIVPMTSAKKILGYSMYDELFSTKNITGNVPT